MTALCPLDHTEARNAADGLTLCRGHLHRLEREKGEMHV